MARRRLTRDVELTEADDHAPDGRAAAPVAGPEPGAGDVPAPGGPARRRPSRRTVLVSGGLVVAVAAGLVVAQQVADRRDAERLARLATVPGVVAPVETPLEVLWSWSSGGLGLPAAVDGWYDPAVLVGLRVADDAAATLVAVAGGTGEETWTVPLVPAAGPLGGAPTPSGVACAALPAAGTDRVVCVASDAYTVWEGTSSYATAPTTSRLLVVDGRTGEVVAEHGTDPADGPPAHDLAVADGRAVLLAAEAGGEGVLRAVDPVTGTEAWRTPLPPDDPAGLSGQLAGPGGTLARLRDGTLVVLRGSGDSLLVDPADGTVLREVPRGSTPALSPQLRTPGGVAWGVGASGTADLVRTDGASTTVVLPTGDLTFPGAHVPVLVDDGSAGDLVLARDGAGVRALDPGTGDARWQVDAGVARSAHVLEGRVHLESAAGVVTVDAATGDELWRRERAGSAPATAPLVDGRLLWEAERTTAPGGGLGADLVGLDPADGTERARVPLPAGLTEVSPYGGRLVGLAGLGTDGVVVVG
ncbi:PQQ-binding-like beta-propeller repeat protein [Cellulomonas sp. 179-A 9B4 NHS]|uniref:outer membrane protein assembly factor BamB family protein n=1 Tax=Cellulomonas sp. 179-A 9B4 NHS TaxID=3142379 RepID=UPI0039A27301